MELTDAVKDLLLKTAKALKGSARRMFLARTVQALGEGGKLLAERELGWNRQTIRKGKQKVEHGLACIDGFRLRGRKRSEDHLPNLLADIRAIVDAREPDRPPVSHHASVYAADGRRSASAIDHPKGVQRQGITHGRDDWEQTQPTGLLSQKSGQESAPKKLPETDAIFVQLKQINEEADADEQTLRISMDAKATVKVGPFARGGKSRVATSAADHDAGASGEGDARGDFPACLR